VAADRGADKAGAAGDQDRAAHKAVFPARTWGGGGLRPSATRRRRKSA
jgi:hypothetical protein